MSLKNSQEIEPLELTPETHFKFRCHFGVFVLTNAVPRQPLS